MSSNIIGQVKECFSDKQQWDTFCLLADRKEEIRKGWLLKLKPALNQCFSAEKLVEGWEFYSGDNDYCWYLKEFGPSSLRIALGIGDDINGIEGNTTDFALYANPDIVKMKTVYQLLHEKKYSLILEAFERKDWLLEDGSWGYVAIEKGNWEFGDKNDGSLDLDQIAWYANYKTDLFVQQIDRKVSAFMKNNAVTQLLYEINEKAKKQR
jgi:hypothetical protein